MLCSPYVMLCSPYAMLCRPHAMLCSPYAMLCSPYTMLCSPYVGKSENKANSAQLEPGLGWAWQNQIRMYEMKCITWEAFDLMHFMRFNIKIYRILSKPKLNHSSQLNSTEFEVRLHSYSDIHHPPPPQELTMLLLLLTAKPAAGRDLCVQLYSHTRVSETLHIWVSNFVLLKIKGFWKCLSSNPKIFGYGRKGYSLDPLNNQRIWCIFFKITPHGKNEVLDKFRYLFFCV